MGYFPTQNLTFVDGDFTTAQPSGAAVFNSPFPGVKDSLSLTQEYMQYNWSFSPLAMNTLHPYYNGIGGAPGPYYLTGETERQDMGGGLVKWRRTYCLSPAQRFESSTMAYLYPGLNVAYQVPGTSNIVPVTKRTPITVVAAAKVQYDYYIVDSGGSLPGGYTDFTQIPVIAHQKWQVRIYNASTPIGLGEMVPPFLWDVGLLNVGSVAQGTVPTASAYVAAIGLPWTGAAAWTSPSQTAPFGGGGIGIGSGWFPATDSQLTRWQGQIFQRVTTWLPVL